MTDNCWPAGPPWRGRHWPPRHRAFAGNRRARIRFFRFVAFAALAFLVLLASAVYVISSMLTARFGFGAWATIVPIALFLLVAMMAFVGMRRFTFPLDSVMDAADRVAGGDYTVRVREYGPPAIRALSRSFNTMTERLQHADRQRRELMADLAHELRTPLSVLQGRLEGLIDDVYPRDAAQLTRLLDETHVLARLIDDLRTLALSDAGALVLQTEITDVSTLVRDVVNAFDADARAASVSLTASPSADVTLEIDPVRVREVLSNLISNALRHTPAGGSVTVSILESREHVGITVRDTGTGLGPEALSRVFDRFYKGADSRGSGLGLTIARSLVRAHGGDLSASSEPGVGTTFRIELPRA